MKHSYFFCTKILYFIEKLLKEGCYQLPDPNSSFAKQCNMTAMEVKEILEQLKHEGVICQKEMSVETTDKYGKFNGEINYPAIVFNKEKGKEVVDFLKKRNFLKEKPFASREVVFSISNEIKKVFTKDDLIRVISSFSQSTYAATVFSDNKYSLTDILFRYSYARPTKSKPQKFSEIIAEFLNPIYISQKQSSHLFKYIDNIFSVVVDNNDYNNWLNQIKKYKHIEVDTDNNTDYLVSFNEENGTLQINESKIKNKKFSDQYYVLKIIFNDKSETAKEWFFSELAEGYDTEADLKDKKFYNAVYQLNKKIAAETGIKDFFITTSESCKINSKYIAT